MSKFSKPSSKSGVISKENLSRMNKNQQASLLQRVEQKEKKTKKIKGELSIYDLVKQDLTMSKYQGKYGGGAKSRKTNFDNVRGSSEFVEQAKMRGGHRNAARKSYSSAIRTPRKGVDKSRNDTGRAKSRKLTNLKTIDTKNTDFKAYYPEEYFKRTGYDFKPLIEDRRANSIESQSNHSKAMRSNYSKSVTNTVARYM
jgi:hypothetical protein